MAAFPVTFPDQKLDAAIRAALGKAAGDEINSAELAGMNDLDAHQKGIINLSGVEYCTKLNHLQLGQNQISDISPLSALVQLSELHLEYNRTVNITAPFFPD